MKFLSLFAVSALLLLSFIGVAGVQAQFAAGPSTSSAGISLNEIDVPLEVVINQASSQVNRRMRVDMQPASWQVREYPVAVVVNDVPVADFQRQIAALLDLNWRKSDELDPLYTLYQSRTAAAKEAAELENFRLQPIRDLEESTKTLMSIIDDSLHGDPKKFYEKHDSEFARFLNEDSLGQAMRDVLAFALPMAISGKFQGLDENEYLMLGPAQMSPQQLATLFRFQTELRRFMSKIEKKDEPEEEEIRPGGSIRITGFNDGDPMIKEIFAGILKIDTPGNDDEEFPLIRPDCRLGEAFARAIMSVNSGTDPDVIEDEMERELEAAAQEMAAEMQARIGASGAQGDEKRNLPPVFQKELELKDDIVDPASLLQFINAETGVDLYCDAWRIAFLNRVNGKMKLEQLLDQMVAGQEMTWEYSNSAVFIRSNDRLKLKAAMVSKEDVKAWAERFEKQEGFTIDDIGYMAMHYTPDQIKMSFPMNRPLDHVAGILAHALPTAKSQYAFYHLLPQRVREAAEREGGVSISQITGDARAWLEECLIRHGYLPDQMLKPGTRLHLVDKSATFESHDKRLKVFEIFVANLSEEMSTEPWIVSSLPKPDPTPSGQSQDTGMLQGMEMVP